MYGRRSELCGFFEDHGIGYVVAVPVDHRVTRSGGVRMRVDAALEPVEARGWNRRSCAAGAKGPRSYDWARIATCSPCRPLLIRRSISSPDEIAYFYASAPRGYMCSLTEPVKIAGTRWKPADDLPGSKSTIGLDQTQARLHRAYKRHITLAMAALALPAVLTAIEKAANPTAVLPDDPGQAQPTDCGTIPPTVPETQRLFHLFSTLTHGISPRDVRARLTLHLRWSTWRRRHRARARRHHYRTRLALIPG